MNCLTFRYSFGLLMLVLAGGASAVGLGELRGQPVLGEGLRLKIELLGQEAQRIDDACFQLVQPVGIGDQPWLKKATLLVRKGAEPALEIRSEAPVREPVVHLAVYLGCGHEVSRSYALLTSSQKTGADILASEATSSLASVSPQRRARAVFRPVQKTTSNVSAGRKNDLPQAIATPAVKPATVPVTGDALDPLLRAASERLSRGEPLTDEQREALRLHLRMLTALQEQASAQLATAEKLRNMEQSFNELQQRSADFAHRVEKEVQAPEATVPAAQAPVPETVTVPPGRDTAKLAAVEPGKPGGSDWSMYGLLLGVVLGLGGWFGWKRYREQPVQNRRDDLPKASWTAAVTAAPVRPVLPPAAASADEPAVAKVSESERLAVVPDADQPAVVEQAPLEFNPQSVFPATALNEHFEANPVMELADIMLSFGRVKGAAQALQEFIDHNPQEALQPWIRLMNVYRMAGMRDEFEEIARNLNRNFNVEVQKWDATEVAAEAPVASGPQSLEEMPRLMNQVLELWTSGDVVGYLYQLLRDNRGGQRLGFALPVVEDILFLIELKETVNRME